MTEHNKLDDAEQLATLMTSLEVNNNILKEHLLSGVIIRHKTYTIKRERDVFTAEKFASELNAVNSLFQIISGNPLNTKEAELFPGFIQVKNDSYPTTLDLTQAVNIARCNIKDFLISRTKKTCVTTLDGVVYTQNPLMYHNHPMVNTMQLYRQLTPVITNINKSSFIWHSNKRYLKFDIEKTINMINSAKLSPAPLHMDHLKWQKDINLALEEIPKLPSDLVITKICSTEPKPHFKFKPVIKKAWTSHYAATSLIIANKDDKIFSIDKKMQSLDVKNKHRNLPIGSQWVPLCESLNLYYQR
jgi:hypothetical protein